MAKKLTKAQQAEKTAELREARIRVLEGHVTSLQNEISAYNEGHKRYTAEEHKRHEDLAALVGRFQQNVDEFHRVFRRVMNT